MHVGWVALFRPPPEATRPTFSEIRDHIAGRVGRAPRYRQRLALIPFDVNHPVWVDDEEFDIDHHVRRTRDQEIGEATDRAMSTALDRDRPLWEMWIADRLRDGRIGVVGKAHHAMIDGLAAVEFASLVLDATRQPPVLDEDGWRPVPAAGSVRLLADGVADRVGRTARLALGSLREGRHPRSVASSATRGVGALVDALRPTRPEPILNAPISAQRHLARAHRPLADLKRIKCRFDATINDVLLAAAAGGVRLYLEQHGRTARPLKAMVPVSMRAQRVQADLGNEVSFVFVELPCDEPDPARRLRTVKAQMDDRKRSGRPEGADLVLRAFSYAPRTFQKAFAHLVTGPRTFNLVVSNIPGPREPLYLLGCELEEAYPVVPIADRHALSIGMTTIKDEACFGIYADCEALPDADLLAESIDASIEELLAIADQHD
jgi:WS/DGAT/MGAT family acyltransferase